MTTYFTSDTHFNHENVIRFYNRPFSSVEEMNEGLISNWNKIVKEDDVVFHLGDFAFAPRQEIPDIVDRLNGHVHLIRGNHDYKSSIKKADFASVEKDMFVNVNGTFIYMIHDPFSIRKKKNEELIVPTQTEIILCGHLHSQWKIKKKGESLGRYIARNRDEKGGIVPLVTVNVGVDVWDMKPVTLNEIMEFVNEGSFL